MLWRRGQSYSQDLRERVFATADDGEPVGRIAHAAAAAALACAARDALGSHRTAIPIRPWESSHSR